MTLITECHFCGEELEICDVVGEGDNYMAIGLGTNKKHYCNKDCMEQGEVRDRL